MVRENRWMESRTGQTETGATSSAQPVQNAAPGGDVSQEDNNMDPLFEDYFHKIVNDELQDWADARMDGIDIDNDIEIYQQIGTIVRAIETICRPKPVDNPNMLTELLRLANSMGTPDVAEI